jgi:hypothetical protein
MADFFVKLLKIFAGDLESAGLRVRALTIIFALMLGGVAVAKGREINQLTIDAQKHLQEAPSVLQELQGIRADSAQMIKQNKEIIERLSRLEGEVRILRLR